MQAANDGLQQQIQVQREAAEAQRAATALELGKLQERSKAQSQALDKRLKTRKDKTGAADVKQVGKPSDLAGTKDKAKKEWSNWSFVFESWFTSQFFRLRRS